MEDAFMQKSVCKVMLLRNKELLAAGTEAGLRSNGTKPSELQLRGEERSSRHRHTQQPGRHNTTHNMTFLDLRFELKEVKHQANQTSRST